METAAFSPELNHVLRCLRAALGTEDWPGQPQLRWEVFVAEVERHRVGAFLYRERAQAPALTSWPEPVEQRLKTIAETTLQRAIYQSAEQIRLLRLLANHGISVIAVKGAGLAQRLYGGLGRRHAGDIDLLIAPGDAVLADRILRSAGLRRTRPDFSLTARQMREYVRIKPEFEYVKQGAAQRIELLWRLESLPFSREIWSRAERHDFGGRPVVALPSDIETLYLFQHGARHGWFRLFWLVDIARLFQRNGAETWANNVSLARDGGTERSLYQGAALAETLLGVAAPRELLPPASEKSTVAGLVAHGCSEISGPTPENESTGDWLRRTAYRVRLQKRLRAKYEVLVPHLFSPESWRTWQLPDRWFFLYYPATPFLWLWRRFFRVNSDATRRAHAIGR